MQILDVYALWGQGPPAEGHGGAEEHQHRLGPPPPWGPGRGMAEGGGELKVLNDKWLRYKEKTKLR